ncbi:hypothetical protein K2X89_15360 [Myxococcota bacterium]|nr:hypothetical protein [Myxococcota bacterium]
MRTCLVLLLLAAALPRFASGDEVLTLESIPNDYDAVEIRTENVADGLYVLFGRGGNVAVSVGDQGVLIVDDLFPELHPKLHKAILADVGRDATIIPGHGEITNGATLSETIEMLKTVRDGIRAGRTREQIIASKPTADFDARFERESNPDDFVDRVEVSLRRVGLRK